MMNYFTDKEKLVLRLKGLDVRRYRYCVTGKGITPPCLEYQVYISDLNGIPYDHPQFKIQKSCFSFNLASKKLRIQLKELNIL